ncbi:MAG: 4-hydroxy-3-methylbut-2-enyl diphosphate reductase [Thermanaerothrix sp.]|nr:4-hydroxy-3-methylbut-2-enyl diphosphate reductase [Thermanaerothrix sp.]
MKVLAANPTGLCFGVRRAIEALERALEERGRVYSIGSPIHNPQEVERLKARGLVVVDDLDEVPPGVPLFVRAHGIAPALLEEAFRKCGEVIDGTCPFVRKAQERARDLSAEGYPVVLVGDGEHPEVRGILGFVKGFAVVVSGDGDPALPKLSSFAKVGVLSQTTQKMEVFSSVAKALVGIVPEVRVYNTICSATLERQRAVCELASMVDGILVIGGRNSANTRKLVQIAQEAGASVLWIEHPDELDLGWLRGRGSIGLAAGGSTPDWLIRELIERLEKL